VLRETARSLWAEPRVPNAPARVWRDWVLVGVLVPVTIVESIIRTDLGVPPLALLLGLISVVSLLWRRTHPLVVVLAAFGAHALSEAVTLMGAEKSAMLFVSASVMILPYSLFRWGSGREAVTGLGVMLFGHIPTRSSFVQTAGQLLIAAVFFLLPAAVGTAVRYRATSKVREIDQVKLREREQLARELHDSVAHHVSAIIIQAQAGRAIAATNPGAAANVLEVIESEATRTLTEMRFMVGALRQSEVPDLLPQCGVADIARFARNTGALPHVNVQVQDGVEHVGPSIGSAMYRLAQEAVTNALRHARHATRINVSLTGDQDWVRLTVQDDGNPNPFGGTMSPGYGMVGMAERAKLLGGTFEAGPNPDRGWTMSATLPKNGTRG
jgi:signal transduction histidine kinase